MQAFKSVDIKKQAFHNILLKNQRIIKNIVYNGHKTGGLAQIRNDEQH